MFNLIVTCVGSKKYEGPSIREAVLNLLGKGIRDDVNELYNEWNRLILKNIESSSLLRKANEIYKGPMWSASIDAFNEINEPKQLWIISCGFGFINSEEKITGYHATFKPGEKDSVYNKEYFNFLGENEVKRQWWSILIKKGMINIERPKSIHELMNNSNPEDIFFVVAGKNYYEAIYDDLNEIKISEKTPKLVFIGVKRNNGKYDPQIPGKLHAYISSFSNIWKLHNLLKKEFRSCNLIQINSRAAQFIIKRYNERGQIQLRFP